MSVARASLPFAGVLAFNTRTHNPVSLDWLEPQEYFGNEERVRQELEASEPVMIVQRKIGSAFGVGPEPRSCAGAKAAAPAFASALLARSDLVFEGSYFCVFVP